MIDVMMLIDCNKKGRIKMLKLINAITKKLFDIEFKITDTSGICDAGIGVYDNDRHALFHDTFQNGKKSITVIEFLDNGFHFEQKWETGKINCPVRNDDFGKLYLKDDRFEFYPYKKSKIINHMKAKRISVPFNHNTDSEALEKFIQHIGKDRIEYK